MSKFEKNQVLKDIKLQGIHFINLLYINTIEIKKIFVPDAKLLAAHGLVES